MGMELKEEQEDRKDACSMERVTHEHRIRTFGVWTGKKLSEDGLICRSREPHLLVLY